MSFIAGYLLGLEDGGGSSSDKQAEEIINSATTLTGIVLPDGWYILVKLLIDYSCSHYTNFDGEFGTNIYPIKTNSVTPIIIVLYKQNQIIMGRWNAGDNPSTSKTQVRSDTSDEILADTVEEWGTVGSDGIFTPNILVNNGPPSLTVSAYSPAAFFQSYYDQSVRIRKFNASGDVISETVNLKSQRSIQQEMGKIVPEAYTFYIPYDIAMNSEKLQTEYANVLYKYNKSLNT